MTAGQKHLFAGAATTLVAYVVGAGLRVAEVELSTAQVVVMLLVLGMCAGLTQIMVGRG